MVSKFVMDAKLIIVQSWPPGPVVNPVFLINNVVTRGVAMGKFTRIIEAMKLHTTSFLMRREPHVGLEQKFQAMSSPTPNLSLLFLFADIAPYA